MILYIIQYSLFAVLSDNKEVLCLHAFLRPIRKQHPVPHRPAAVALHRAGYDGAHSAIEVCRRARAQTVDTDGGTDDERSILRSVLLILQVSNVGTCGAVQALPFVARSCWCRCRGLRRKIVVRLLQLPPSKPSCEHSGAILTTHCQTSRGPRSAAVVVAAGHEQA